MPSVETERGVGKKGEKMVGGSSRSKDVDVEEKEVKKRPRLILSDSDSDELSISDCEKVDYRKNDDRDWVNGSNDNGLVQVKEETKEEVEEHNKKNADVDNKKKSSVINRKRILRSDVSKQKKIKEKVAVRSQLEKKRSSEPSNAEAPLKKMKTDLSRLKEENVTGPLSGKKLKKDSFINGDVNMEIEENSVEDSNALGRDRRERHRMLEKPKDSNLKQPSNNKAEKVRLVERTSRRILPTLKDKGSSLAGHKSREAGISQHKEGIVRVQGKGGLLKILRNNKTSNVLQSFNAEGSDEENLKVLGSSRITRGSLKQTYLSQDRQVHEKLSSPPPLVKDQAKTKLSLSRKGVLIERRTMPKVLSPQRDSKKVDKSDSNTESKANSKSFSKKPVLTKQKANKAGGDTSTMKKKLRQQIKDILLSAGWKIDLRPRRGKDYLDSVYIPPEGPGSYWSITKAYAVYQDQLNQDQLNHAHANKSKKLSAKSSKTSSGNNSGTSSSSSIIPVESLNLLKRVVVNKRRSKEELEDAKKGKRKKTKGSFKKSNPKNYHGKGRLDDVIQRKKSNGNLDFSTNGIASSKLYKYHRTGKNKQKGCALLARGANQEAETENDDYVPYLGKRTLLSWMIDMGVVPVNGKVNYMNNKRTKTKLEGRITTDGIHCSCCSKILTIAKFELHAGSKLHQAFENIYVEGPGVSLLECQLNAWENQDESERQGFYTIDVSGDDPNDDTCGICGDGGDLICCDGCPSTFHLSCLGIQKLPPGEWNCTNCSCKFCGEVSKDDDRDTEETLSPLFSCSQCEEKYHQDCVPESDSISVSRNNSGPSFCGQGCRKVFGQLQKLLGVKNDLDAGFSWSLIRRLDEGTSRSSFRLPQRAECNSKSAVALAVMDECFLPITDQRSGFNLIHNVVYNCGSNFNRLNYKGFYTFILERGDEIISAASVRIHGTRLAEMPFIGTRNMYRRQGMCRRLLDGIETALCSLNVEKLVIPAISELKDTWTAVFGFKPLEVSQELDIRSINLLVFPGTGLLQKPLLKKQQVVVVDCKEDPDVMLKADLHNSDQVAAQLKNGVVGSCLPVSASCVSSTSNSSPGSDVPHESEVKTLGNVPSVGGVAYLQSCPENVFSDQPVGEAKSEVDFSANETSTGCIAVAKCSSEIGFASVTQESIDGDEVLAFEIVSIPSNVSTQRESKACTDGASHGSDTISKISSVSENRSQASEQIAYQQNTDLLKEPSGDPAHPFSTKKCQLCGLDFVESSNVPSLPESILSSKVGDMLERCHHAECNLDHNEDNVLVFGEISSREKASDSRRDFKDVTCELNNLSRTCKSCQVPDRYRSLEGTNSLASDVADLQPDIKESKEGDFEVLVDPCQSCSQFLADTCSLVDEVAHVKPVHPCLLSAVNCGSEVVNKMDKGAESTNDTANVSIL